MGNVVFIESMPEGSYDFLEMMKCEIKDNPLYQGLNCSSSPKWTRKMIINYIYF